MTRSAKRIERSSTLLSLVALGTLLWLSGIGTALAEFVVQVGAYASADHGAAVVARLHAAGFSASTEVLPGSSLTAVSVGPYPSKRLANRARDLLNEKGWRGFVRPAAEKSSPEVPTAAPVAAPAKPHRGVPTPATASAQDPAANQPAEGSAGASGIAGLFAPEPSSKPAKPASPARKGIGGLFEQPPAAQQAPAPGNTGNTGNKGIGGLFGAEPTTAAPSPFGTQQLRPHGFFLSRLAYTYPTPGHWSLFENLLKAGIEHHGDRISWKVSGWVRYDPVYAHSDFYPSAVREDQRFDAMIRETYLDLSAGNWDLRLGRQQIVWGEMVGLFFADVVSALDTRQFVAQDFDLIRIPQWAARAEYFKGDFHGEAIWIPYMSYDNIGKPGGDFYPYPLPPPAGYGMLIDGENKPHGLSDGAYGLRMGYLLNDWDLTAFYYNSMNRAPTFFRTVVAGPTPTVVYRPDHTRIQQVGGTMSKAFSNTVLKAEAVYTRNQYYNVYNLTDANGVVKQNTLDYAIGLDYSLPHNSRVDVQFYQRWFINHNPDIVPDRFESGISVLASTAFADQKIKPQILLLHSLNRDDWMVSPQVRWDFATNWQATLGADIFSGPQTGFFGQFDNSDRVYAEARYAY
ncbi:MAG: DUF1302 family protein [Gammaproteobacteria bacterium]